jgi:nucleoside-diphosphate-sugar epimerase
MAKKILVTGGLGFIGRTLLSYLLARDDISYIDVVDNLCNSTISDTDPLCNDSRVTILKHSVKQFIQFKRWQSVEYNQIYHLASPVGPAGVLNYAGQMGPMIVEDVHSMVNLALKNNARLLDISTSEVYGKESGDTAQKEDIDKIVPSNITVRLEYGVSKLLSEIFLINRSKVSSLQANLIRPFNIVGVGQKGEVGFVLPRFVEAALAGNNLTVFGTGQQERTFTSVKDFTEGIMLVMDSDVSGEIFNVGNAANRYSILDLANIVIEMTQSSSQIEFVDPKDIYGPLYAEAWNKIPDSTKVREALGWNPTRSIRDIVQEVIESYV